MSKPTPVLDDANRYPTKDWMDREVTQPEDLNAEILVWQITPSLSGNSCHIRSRQEALDYFKEVVEQMAPGPDGELLPDEDYHAAMQLVPMTLGDYINREGEE